MSNTLFAVRHVPSGKFLPVTKKGYTSVDLASAEDVAPRMHKSHRSAVQAMHAWCRGKYVASWEYWSSDDPYSSAGGMYVDDMKIQKMKNRHLCEMEVVEVHLSYRSIGR